MSLLLNALPLYIGPDVSAFFGLSGHRFDHLLSVFSALFELKGLYPFYSVNAILADLGEGTKVKACAQSALNYLKFHLLLLCPHPTPPLSSNECHGNSASTRVVSLSAQCLTL